MTFLLILLASVVGGTNTPLVKLNVSFFPPVMVAFLRFFIALIFIMLFFLFKKFKIKSPTRNLIAINGLFAANILIFVYAIGKTSIIAAQVLYLLTAVFVAILGYLILNEKLIKSQVVGLLIAIVGLFILITSSVSKNDIMSTGTPLGNILTFIAVIDWSLYVVYSRKLSKEFTPLEITIYNFATTAILSFAFVLFGLTHNLSYLNNLSAGKILSVLAMAFFSTVLFFFLYQWVIKNTSAFISTMVNYLATACAAIVGVVFFYESLTLYMLAGIMLITLGAYLSSIKNFRIIN